MFRAVSIFAFAVVGLSLVNDAFGAITCRKNNSIAGQRACTTAASCPSGWTKISNTCTTQTVGGSITFITHSGISVTCNWADFQGAWSADPGNGTSASPMTVEHSVDGDNVATCTGTEVTLGDKGTGLFNFSITYQSPNPDVLGSPGPATCTVGVGGVVDDNCRTSTSAPIPQASRACREVLGGGTRLTYQYSCSSGLPADMGKPGVKVSGSMTLVPVINGNPQVAPAFTGPCSPERVAAGQCIQRLGGIPTNEGVVNDAACADAFPAGTNIPIPPPGPDNDQELGAKKIVFYQEATSSGTCDESHLPTSTAKSLTAAYGAYCHSDRGDICPVNLVSGEGEELVCPVPLVPGFDDVLRVCPVEEDHQHTGTQFATGVQLAGTISPNGTVSGGVAVLPDAVLNANCAPNPKNEGVYKLRIPDQERLAQADVEIGGGFNLDLAPKLHAENPPQGPGVAPVAAVPNVLVNGVLTLELSYKKCAVANEIFDSLNPDPKDGAMVPLFLTGNTKAVTEEPGDYLGGTGFKSNFTVKITGVKK